MIKLLSSLQLTPIFSKEYSAAEAERLATGADRRGNHFKTLRPGSHSSDGLWFGIAISMRAEYLPIGLDQFDELL
jgi:hypothetical protein